MAVARALAFVGLAAAAVAAAGTTDAPIIGVWTQPVSGSWCEEAGQGSACEYVAASYIKFVEGAGGRVVPIPYNASLDFYDTMLESLNGFLFPGGGADLPVGAQYVFDRVVEMNKRGVVLPLWGHCLGIEWLLEAAARDTGVLDQGFDSENLTLALDFTSLAASSRMFGEATPELYDAAGTEPITFNNHVQGITPADFAANARLSKFYNVLSTNKDRQGTEFVSCIEAADEDVYVFGIQWHAEKNVYEWGKNEDGSFYEAIPHTPHAVELEQHMANTFMSFARMNDNAFADPSDEEAALIYNYAANAYDTTPDFMLSYIFPLNWGA